MIFIIKVKNNVLSIEETNKKMLETTKKVISETMVYMIEYELLSLDYKEDHSKKEKILIETLFDDEKLVEYSQKEALVEANKLIRRDATHKLIELIEKNKEKLDWDTVSIVENLRSQSIKTDIIDERLEIRKIIDRTFEELDNNMFLYNVDDNIEFRAVAYFLMYKLANEVLKDLINTN